MNDRNEHPTGAAATPQIEVQCLSCGRTGSFASDDSRVSGTPLVQLTRRFRCSACGSRAVKATSVRTPRDLAKLLRTRMQSGRG
jgi:DNA-directed RNA polymerase subunit RPC12/RpoP